MILDLRLKIQTQRVVVAVEHHLNPVEPRSARESLVTILLTNLLFKIIGI